MKLSPEQLSALRAVPASAGPNRLRVAFAMAGLKQSDISELTRFTPQQLSKFVRGAYVSIDVEHCRVFADLLGCAIEDLFPPSVREQVAS